MSKIGFISLGCAKNQVDLERLAGAVSKSKMTFTKTPSEADFMVVNTCGFIKDAIEEAIDAILTMRQEIRPDAKLIVFGCMSERFKDDFAVELPDVDFFAGVGEKAMQEVLHYISKESNHQINDDLSGRYLFNAPYYAYLKISEGCNNRCSYCTIPSIRGSLCSVPMDALLVETKQLVSGGAKEIIIISQDSTKYGTDLKNGSSLPKLLDALAAQHPNVNFRVMYLNPDGVTRELIETVKNHNNIFRYFDIPVQHGSDKVLKLMNRKSTRGGIESVFSMIREILPDAFIRTTMIVGFPGESDEDFAMSRSFISDIKPDFAGFFPYSPEDGTPAASKEQIAPAVVAKRIKELQRLQKKNTTSRLNSLKKGEIVCYVEKTNADFEFILEGRAYFQSPEIDGQLFVTDGEATDGYGPYRAIITKVAYPDIYVTLLGSVEGK